MSAFKDMVAADNDAFINLDEFAEEHDLNGTVTKAVVEGKVSKERHFRVGTIYEGIYEGDIVAHVKKSDLPEVPVRDEIFNLDGVSYLVAECTDDMGILSIELRANLA